MKLPASVIAMLGTSPKTTVAGVLKAIGVVLIGVPVIELASGTGEQILGPKLALAFVVVGMVLQATAEAIGGYLTRDNDVSDDDAPAKSKSSHPHPSPLPSRAREQIRDTAASNPQPPTPGGATTDGHGSA